MNMYLLTFMLNIKRFLIILNKHTTKLFNSLLYKIIFESKSYNYESEFLNMFLFRIEILFDQMIVCL